MLVTDGFLAHRYDEAISPGRPRLGRHLALDAKSLAYTVERQLGDAILGPIKPAEHVSPIDTLDQGQRGSCTGNAGTYAEAALVGAGHLADVHLAGQTLSASGSNEAFAVELYHQATQDDGFPGTYPPDDTGSSGLGVCRALRAAGLVGRYDWATTLRGVGHLLQRGGAMIGTPWYSAWFSPDSHGFIDSDPSWQASGIAGGHELYVEALEAWDDHDPSKSWVRLRNSWGASWGDRGCGRMRLSTYMRLRSQIDWKQLRAA